jgi:transcriptional antiterminator NusG
MDNPDGRIIWPRRSLIVKKLGRKIEALAPLYPGYLFWETEGLSSDSLLILKKIPGFIRFLKRGDDISPLTGPERDILAGLLTDGDMIRRSKVEFSEDSRIRVIEGPLKMLEGQIVRVDKRKGRARVILSLHGRCLEVDLGFDIIIKASGTG